MYFFMESLNPAESIHGDRGLRRLRAVDGGNHTVYRCWGVDYVISGDGNADITLPVQPSITSVCRQIRAETLPIFYGSNRFLLFDRILFWKHGKDPFPKVLTTWFAMIRQHLSLMSDVGIRSLNDSDTHETVALLTDADFPSGAGVLRSFKWEEVQDDHGR